MLIRPIGSNVVRLRRLVEQEMVLAREKRGAGETRGQPANRDAPGKWPLKWCVATPRLMFETSYSKLNTCTVVNSRLCSNFDWKPFVTSPKTYRSNYQQNSNAAMHLIFCCCALEYARSTTSLSISKFNTIIGGQ